MTTLEGQHYSFSRKFVAPFFCPVSQVAMSVTAIFNWMDAAYAISPIKGKPEGSMEEIVVIP
jgi:hypothetical protein